MTLAKSAQPNRPASLKRGERVTRTHGEECGTVVEVTDHDVKVKWDGGATSYFRHGSDQNVRSYHG